jgi:hypothetical protein
MVPGAAMPAQPGGLTATQETNTSSLHPASTPAHEERAGTLVHARLCIHAKSGREWGPESARSLTGVGMTVIVYDCDQIPTRGRLCHTLP